MPGWPGTFVNVSARADEIVVSLGSVCGAGSRCCTCCLVATLSARFVARLGGPVARTPAMGFVAVLFESPAPAQKDSQYAIVAKPSESGPVAYLWYTSFNDVYPAGAHLSSPLLSDTGTPTEGLVNGPRRSRVQDVCRRPGNPGPGHRGENRAAQRPTGRRSHRAAPPSARRRRGRGSSIRLGQSDNERVPVCATCSMPRRPLAAFLSSIAQHYMRHKVEIAVHARQPLGAHSRHGSAP
jgi:hypothetical protein